MLRGSAHGSATVLGRPKAPIRGLLFDKDGTLFDFTATWRAIAIDIIARLAPDAEAAARMSAIGGLDRASGTFLAGSLIVAGANRDIAEAWARFRPDLGVDGLEAALEQLAADLAAAGPPPVPAAPDLPGLLAALAEAGRALGVATNDSVAGAHRDLEAGGILGRFDLILGYDSVARPKPAPDVIHAFSAHIGSDAASVAMIGDSRHDLEAARAAGAGLAVGVLTGPATAADLAPFADAVIPSIADLPALLATL